MKWAKDAVISQVKCIKINGFCYEDLIDIMLHVR